MKYDLIIIGTGPAGLTAGVYAARHKLNALIFGQIPGGTAGEAHKVCNFPSYEAISGNDLMQKFINHVKTLGVQINQENVLEISGIDNNFEVTTSKGKYQAKKIILATGSQRKKLGLDKEAEFLGKGVSYCATCDAGFYKDKTVAVIGGGNAALTSALLLASFAKKVYVIYRKEKFFRAEPAWVSELEKLKNTETIFQTNVTKIIGEKNLEKIELDNGKEITLDGLFLEVGSIPMTKLAEQLNVKLENGEIQVDKNFKTSIKGIFAAGDVTNNPFKQIITACGEGATALHSAYTEIRKKSQ